MPISRRHTFPFALVAGVTALTLSSSLPAGASRQPSAASVLKAVKVAMAKVSGVHVSVSSKNGPVVSSVEVDIGATSGMEKITTGTSHITIVVNSRYAYLSGNASGLTTLMGLTTAQLKKIGTKSIAIKAGSAPYVNLHGNLTTTVLASMLPAAIGTTVISAPGSKGYLLTWNTAATSSSSKITSVLEISSSSLPVKETITSATGSGKTVFSKWGEHVKVKTPTSSSVIAYKKVTG